MRRSAIILLCCALLGSPASLCDDTLRVATYNILNYPGADAAQRNPRFRTVLRAIDPDVLIVQEMTSSAGVTQFREQVLNAVHPGAYASVPFDDGPDTDNAMFYKPARIAFLGAAYISTPLRRIAEYRFLAGGAPDTVRLYSLHLKGNQEDSLDRLAETTILRNVMNALPSGALFLVGGDFNIYGSTEPAFGKLTGSEPDNDGRSIDLLNAVGTWHANYAFRALHTQSTRLRDFGGGTTGGLDDRFDMLLASAAMAPRCLLTSYTAYGNDGTHYNDSINQPPNSAVADSIADALHESSDHLPVFADFLVGGGGADTGFVSIASGSWSTPATWSGGAIPGAASAVTVTQGTTVTIDASASCRTLTVAGVLQFGATSGRNLTAGSDVTIAPGGVFRASASFTSGSTVQTLAIGGSFTNDGSFSPRVQGSASGVRVCDATFTGAAPAVIGGTAGPATFNSLRMELAGSAVTLTPLVGLTCLSGATNALALVRGTWVQSTGQTTAPSVTVTVESTAVLAVSDGGAFTTGTGSLIVRGALAVSGGVLTVGAGNGRLEVVPGAFATFSGGITTVNGALLLSGGATEISGGTITLNPRGLFDLDPESHVLGVAAEASVVVSGGTITIAAPRVLTSDGREVSIAPGSGLKHFTGGTLALGVDGGTPAGSDTGFAVESGVPLASFAVRTGGGTGKNVSLMAPLVAERVELMSGRFSLAPPSSPGFSLIVLRRLGRSSGGLDVTGGRVTLGPASPVGIDTLVGEFTGTDGFCVLELANPGGTLVAGDVEIRDSLVVSGNDVSTGGRVITLDSTAWLVEGTSPVRGHVETVRRLDTGVPGTFGGLGLTITAGGTAPGPTHVRRTIGEPVIIGTTRSIERRFEIRTEAGTGLDARLDFRYAGGELGGQDQATLSLFSSSDSGATWLRRGGSVDTAAHVITLEGIGGFSLWTAADAANRLDRVTVAVPMQDGWNMVANPVATPLDSVILLFPGCGRRTAYRFETAGGYVPESRLLNGTGYWLKCGGGEAEITGAARERDSIFVAPGWNMIGGLSVMVDTAAIEAFPTGLVASPYFHYKNGLYVQADTLFPGSGYWVKASGSGMLILGAPAAGNGPQIDAERTDSRRYRQGRGVLE